MRLLTLSLIAACVLLSALTARAQGDSADRVRITIAPARTNVFRGDVLAIAVIMDHDEGWHTQPHKLELPPELGLIADTLVATDVQADSNPNLTAHNEYIQWPRGEETRVKFGREPVLYHAYEWRTIIFLPVSISQNAELGPTSTTVTVKFQACDESTCLQPATVTERVQFHITTAEHAQPQTDVDQTVFAGFDAGVWDRIGIDPDAALTRNESGNSTIILFGGIGVGVLFIIGVVFFALLKRK